MVVAEDDDELRMLVASLLAHDGFEVVQVRNGNELLDYVHRSGAAAEGPDLILSDICMPGATGIDVLSQLQREHISTPVVLMTAFPDPGIALQADTLGAVTLVAKPFELDDLRMIVLNLTDGAHELEPPASRPS